MRVPRFLAAVAMTSSLALAGTMAAATGGERAAGAGDGGDCSRSADTPKRQFRGEWIASVVNIDWPSRPGLTPAEQKKELRSWYNEAADRGLNAVVVQIRPTADTFWPSELEPWSKYLTGEAGGDPGYDPLRFAVRAAHRRNLEFHAWFNPYRVSMSTDREALAPGSPARRHPDWVVAYGGKLYFDPGIPEVRAHVEDVILEVVERYDVDAVHFDDYFYPYPVAGQEFPDDETFAEHGAGFSDRGDWRRHNVDLLISELDHRIHTAKPWVKFGVSPFAVWRNASTDPEGSQTTAGAETYDDLYADTRRWVREEWLDYVVPQVYWSIGFAPADYAALVPWWSEQVEGTDVQLQIGQATYKVGTSTQHPAWQDPEEMSRHLYFNRDYPQVSGDVFFSAKDVRANRLGNMDLVQRDHYSRPALLPVTPGVPGGAPQPVALLAAERGAEGVTLTWRGRGSSYAVYRVDGPEDRRCALSDGEHLVAVLRDRGQDVQQYLDTEAPSDGQVTYYVTALDRAYRESRPGRPATVR